MQKKKVAVFIGSRANWGRLRSVCEAIDKSDKLELQIILGASGVSLDIPYPCERIECLLSNDTTQAMSITTSLLLCQISAVLERTEPLCVLVHGDRYEVLAVAIASAYQNILLAHTEGGEDTGTIDDKVRYAITSLADIHFPVTDKACERLSSLATRIYKVGSPSLDQLRNMDLSCDREPYVLVLQHPDSVCPEPLTPLVEVVKQIPIHKIWINPNVDAGNKEMLKIIHSIADDKSNDVEFVKNLPPLEYYKLLANAKCCIGNSSSFIKEGAFLGTPVVLIGGRQQNREVGKNVFRVPNIGVYIANAVYSQLAHGKYEPDYLFGDGTSGQKIADILTEVL